MVRSFCEIGNGLCSLLLGQSEGNIAKADQGAGDLTTDPVIRQTLNIIEEGVDRLGARGFRKSPPG